FPVGMLLSLIVVNCKTRRSRVLAFTLLLLLGLVTQEDARTYLVSVIVVMAAALLTKDPAPWLKKLAGISFGVYLAHVLFIESIQFGAPKLGANVHSLPMTLSVIIGAAMCSIGVCLVLARGDRTRWLVQ
ncbi:MAG: hypothetical protein AAGJ83_10795, partial [Planctomycetota bacterium]